jgi:hypothetical protein
MPQQNTGVLFAELMVDAVGAVPLHQSQQRLQTIHAQQLGHFAMVLPTKCWSSAAARPDRTGPVPGRPTAALAPSRRDAPAGDGSAAGSQLLHPGSTQQHWSSVLIPAR